MCRPPNRLTVSATAASTLVRSRTSHCTKWASPPEFLPRARADVAAASPLAASISAMTTLAPSSAKRSAVARPMPRPPPVMNATLPANRAMPQQDIGRWGGHARPAALSLAYGAAPSPRGEADRLGRGAADLFVG